MKDSQCFYTSVKRLCIRSINIPYKKNNQNYIIRLSSIHFDLALSDYYRYIYIFLAELNSEQLLNNTNTSIPQYPSTHVTEQDYLVNFNKHPEYNSE